MSEINENTQSFNSAKNRIIVYLLVVTIFIIFLTLFANTWVSEQKVKSIVIKGNSFIPNNELYELIKDDTISSKVNNISLFELKRKIEEHPFVKEAFVIKRNTSLIEIEVIERYPKAMVVNNNGELRYIDDQSYILPYRLSQKFKSLPVLQGCFVGDSMDTLSVRNALKLLNSLNKSKNHFDISELNFNRTTKEFTLISSNYLFPIKLGRMSDIAEKLKKIKSLPEIMLKASDINKLDYVDLRWKDKVILSFNDINFLY